MRFHVQFMGVNVLFNLAEVAHEWGCLLILAVRYALPSAQTPQHGLP